MDDTSLTVCELTPDEIRAELDALARLHFLSFKGTERAGTPESARSVLDWLTRDFSPEVFVANWGDEACGYALGFEFRPNVFEHHHFGQFPKEGAMIGDYYYSLIGVLPARRERGVAKTLFNAQFERFGSKIGWTRTWPKNVSSIEMVKRRGFVEHSRTDKDVLFKRPAS